MYSGMCLLANYTLSVISFILQEMLVVVVVNYRSNRPYHHYGNNTIPHDLEKTKL